MPTEYPPRNRAMHSREVRYERNERFLGKRDWGRAAAFDRGGGGGGGAGGGGVAPGLSSSSNGGSYDPPSKRRASGRHGFGVESTCRELPRAPENAQHQSMFNGSGYFVPHKNERYGPGGMSHYGRRNGVTDEFFSREEEALPPSSVSHHSFASYYDAPSHLESHRGSRYGGWDRTDREHTEVFDRKSGVSRYGGFGFQAPETRQDRYASRDASVGEVRSRDVVEEPPLFESGVQQQRAHWSQLHDPEPVSSPRKKTRLGWGDGLASYEQKHTSRIRQCEEEREVKQNCQSQDVRPLVEQHEKNVVMTQQTDLISADVLSDPHLSDQEISPVRERTPVADVATVTGSPAGVEIGLETQIERATPSFDAEQQLENGYQQANAEEEPSGKLSHHDDPQRCADAGEQPLVGPLLAEVEKQPPLVSLNHHGEKQAQDVEQTHQELQPASDVKVRKERVLLQIEQVEIEIDAIEKGIVRLDVEMEADAARTAEAERLHDGACVLENETAAVVEISQVIAADMDTEENNNQLDDPSTWPVSEDLAHLFPEHLRRWSVKLYGSPEEAPTWLSNVQLHHLNKSKLLQRMFKTKVVVKFKEKLLVLRHKILKMHTDDLDVAVIKRALMEPICQQREVLKMPPMILCAEQRTCLDLVTTNRLVEDPDRVEEERKTINPWTSEERKLFLEKFALFNKNFSKIASFIRNKSTGDCVEFYYRNQKSEDFAKLRKKQQLKKRHSRASYLATTTCNSRLRDSSAGAIAYATSTVGRVSRSNMKVAGKERLNFAPDCVAAETGGRKVVTSGNISTGVCSLSSDAPLTPSGMSCERAFSSREDHYTKQKGVRSSRGRREHAADEADSDWTDGERELFLDALLLYGKDFRSVALHVRSKNESQCKTFFSKARKRLKLERILEQHRSYHQAPVLVSRKPVSEMAVVNRACDDIAAAEINCGHNRLANVTDRSFESEDMDVSVVVDSGPKGVPDPDNEAPEPESNMEGTSAAPGALADSPVSSVITSPGLVSSSSPAVQANGLQKVANDFTSKPLTECASNECKPGDARSMHVKTEVVSRHVQAKDELGSEQSGLTDSATMKNGVTGPAWLGQHIPQLHPSQGLLSVLNPGVQLPTGVFQKQQQTSQVAVVPSEQQQQMMVLQQLMSRQIADDQALQQSLVFKQQQLLALLQSPINQENNFTNNQKLLALQAFLQEHKLHEPQHVFNFLAQPTQPQQAVVSGLDSNGFQNGFPQQQEKVVSELAVTGDGAGPFVTNESLQSHERRTDDQQNKSSDIKLFGQSLLSQPAPPKACSDPPPSLTMLAPQLVQRSYGSDCQDRAMTFRSGVLPDGLKQEVVDWQIHGRPVNGTNTCTREALNLWRAELMKSASFSAAGGVAATSGLCQHQVPQQQQLQQQMFPAHLMQFPNGNGWKTGVVGVVSNGGNLQSRVLAPMSLAEQHQQQLHQHHQHQQQHHSGKA